MLNDILYEIGEFIAEILTFFAEGITPAIFVITLFFVFNPVALAICVALILCLIILLIRRYIKKQRLQNNEYKVGLVDGVKLMKKLVGLLLASLIIFLIVFFVILYYERTKLGLPLFN